MDDSDRLSALRNELLNRLGRQRYESWMSPQSELKFTNEGLIVVCTSRFEVQFMRRKIHAHLAASCQAVVGRQVAIEYRIQTPPTESSHETTSSYTQRQLFESEGSSQSRDDAAACERFADSGGTAVAIARPNTHKKHVQVASTTKRASLAEFVVGPCNELAWQTVRTIADRLGRFGPLLLYGPPGVGKTHLLHALHNCLRKGNRRLRVVRQTAEQFTSTFLDALHQRSVASFRQKMRSIDVLLIDDIQFLAGKRATLDEMLTTLDSLLEHGKQVVLTSDCSPAELRKVSAELGTKISGGLAIPMELPNYGTRVALVQHFIHQMHPAIGMAIDERIATLIATKINGSARQLQGAINRLVVTSEALRKPLTLELARSVLTEYVQQITPLVRLTDIQRAVCEVFGVEPGSLKSKRKTRTVAEPRMVAMWLACDLTRSALGEISEFFGRRSHSTVIAAQRRVERMVSRGESIAISEQMCSVEEAIRQVRLALHTA